MIQQTAKGLNSRSEANPYNEDGFLPLITAPMSSVVNETNYQTFFDNRVQICFSRTTDLDEVYNDVIYKDSFHSLSLNDFIKTYVDNKNQIGGRPHKRCIDTANGNIPALHDAIKKAKEIHGDNLVIMAGNVASVEAFVGLAKTGVDYIRVGIGGGGGCNTTSNTGVGQENLESLITQCWIAKHNLTERLRQHERNWKEFEEGKRIIHDTKEEYFNRDFYIEQLQINKIKIVADGISSYIKQCESKYGFNDNGYAAINKLLFAGADLVMVGKLFAQCLESAGEKRIDTGADVVIHHQKIRHYQQLFSKDLQELKDRFSYGHRDIVVKYSGMSTQEEQKKYQPLAVNGDSTKMSSYELETSGMLTQQLKPSEGSIQWIPVRWTLNEWLNGSDKQDEAPYLMGWINSIKSTMAYTGKTKL